MAQARLSTNDIVDNLYAAEKILGQEVDPLAMTASQYGGNILQKDRLVTRIVPESRTFLMTVSGVNEGTTRILINTCQAVFSRELRLADAL